MYSILARTARKRLTCSTMKRWLAVVRVSRYFNTGMFRTLWKASVRMAYHLTLKELLTETFWKHPARALSKTTHSERI